MKYAEAKASELNWLGDFYDQCGYGGNIDGRDHVVFAFDGNNPIGVGRLSEEQGIVVLRGMQVLDGYRRRGVGKVLLDRLLSLVGNRPCYCLPHSWLIDLYKNAGFRELPIEKVPEIIRDRYIDYRMRPLDVLLLVYMGDEKDSL